MDFFTDLIVTSLYDKYRLPILRILFFTAVLALIVINYQYLAANPV